MDGSAEDMPDDVTLTSLAFVDVRWSLCCHFKEMKRPFTVLTTSLSRSALCEYERHWLPLFVQEVAARLTAELPRRIG